MLGQYVDKNIIPLRQIHLDFHTSPHIKGIGSRFSKEQFQAELKRGKVQSITIFAKCHHGLCYYPTKVGTMHPGLDFDLLGEMLDACHEIGVRAPIYITTAWSELDAEAHPEWLAIKSDGTPDTKYDFNADKDTPKPEGGTWRMLCMNDGEYCQHIYALTEEICRRYKKVDGIFYDIVFHGNICYCDSCKKGMREMGLDPENPADAKIYYDSKHLDFARKCKEIIDTYHENATVFFNSGGADLRRPQYHPASTHYEMEDLPTAWGGYNKMPPRARFFSTLGKYYLGMTGKFHHAWGEFGGFKPKEALKYEAASMALYGAGMSIGDHLYPDGEMDEQTYENVGYAFDYLEKITPYCYGGEYVNNIGIYYTLNTEQLHGISDLLLENQIDYRFVIDNDYSGLDAVIFPSGAMLDDKGLKALNEFTANGGKVLLIEKALLKDGKYQIDVGAEYKEDGKFDCDYILPGKELLSLEELPKKPFLSYFVSPIIKNVDADVYAEIYQPLFSRTYGHFCGHKNTPYAKDGDTSPALIKKGNVVYISHNIPKIYKERGSVYHRRYFAAALKLLGYKPLLNVDLYSGGRVTALKQADKNRYCVNMVYASPVKRGFVEIIDEILPIYNIKTEIKVDEKIKRVYDPISGKDLPFTLSDGVCTFTVDELNCHKTVVLEY